MEQMGELDYDQEDLGEPLNQEQLEEIEEEGENDTAELP